MTDLVKMQEMLKKERELSWLFYNFHGLDPFADSILKMPSTMLSRRWFYFVPAQGSPVKLVHKIESGALDHLPGEKMQYATWKELHGQLKKMLTVSSVCMQYSPQNAIPYVSFVDAGTVELIKTTGVEVRSSADLIQHFEAVWSEDELRLHKEAADKLGKIAQQALIHVQRHVDKIDEYRLQQYILKKFDEENMICDHPPIIAVNEHSGNPHFEPQQEKSAPIRKGDFLLMDMWAKDKSPDGIYADITWVAMVDDKVPEKHAAVFSTVSAARDAAVEFVQKQLAQGQKIYGYQVDDACRQVIENANYGDYFIHRTGHNIGREVHGAGVNMDNYETRDERKLLDGVGFSIEPGIYLPEFGIRSEIDVYIHQGQAHVSTLPKQEELPALLG